MSVEKKKKKGGAYAKMNNKVQIIRRFWELSGNSWRKKDTENFQIISKGKQQQQLVDLFCVCVFLCVYVCVKFAWLLFIEKTSKVL